jgi:hypothetical protein
MVLKRLSSDVGLSPPTLNFGKPVRCAQADPGDEDLAARNAASIFDWTRLAASAISLVCVLPVLILSPISNRHSQTSGSAVATTLYSTPL